MNIEFLLKDLMKHMLDIENLLLSLHNILEQFVNFEYYFQQQKQKVIHKKKKSIFGKIILNHILVVQFQI